MPTSDAARRAARRAWFVVALATGQHNVPALRRLRVDFATHNTHAAGGHDRRNVDLAAGRLDAASGQLASATAVSGGFDNGGPIILAKTLPGNREPRNRLRKDITERPPLNGDHQNAPSSATIHSPQSATAFTRTAAAWSALTVGLLVLTVLLVFVTQNTAATRFDFLGWHWNLPLGVAILLAAVCGGLITAMAATAKIYQLRRAAKKHLTASGQTLVDRPHQNKGDRFR